MYAGAHESFRFTTGPATPNSSDNGMKPARRVITSTHTLVPKSCVLGHTHKLETKRPISLLYIQPLLLQPLQPPRSSNDKLWNRVARRGGQWTENGEGGRKRRVLL
ncbi:hypothetical protein MN608_05836 [Microdochium nivale]|nr:hypothetical protein MN608_05836 [Microdochium nivale]